MTELDENQKIQKITDLLEKGGTMLANHHDCGAPMFRYRGKIVCPVCDIGKGEQPGNGEKAARVEKPVPVPSVPVPGERTTGPDTEIESHVRSKVVSLAAGIRDETDLQRLRDKMECIELGIRILKSLKN